MEALLNHYETCQDVACSGLKLFCDDLNKSQQEVVNNYDNVFRKCSDIFVYLKKNLSNHTNVLCLENLFSLMCAYLHTYAEYTQLCQKFIQTLCFVQRMKPICSEKGLKIFWSEVEHVFEPEDLPQDESHVVVQLRAFSMMLESLGSFGEMMEKHGTYLLNSINSKFTVDLIKDTTVIKKQKVYFMIKIMLQLFQLMTKQRNNCISNKMFLSSMKVAILILKEEDSTKDSQLIAASVVCSLLKFINDEVLWSGLVSLLFNILLGSTDVNKISADNMGSIVLCGTLLTFFEPERLSSPFCCNNSTELKFTNLNLKETGCLDVHLNLLSSDLDDFVKDIEIRSSGKIEGVRKEIFMADSNGFDGSITLFSFIFQFASSSCKSSSNMQYQSLKLLQQWFNVLPSYQDGLRSNLPLDTIREEVTGLILTYIDSQVDGVDRNAVDLLYAFLQSFMKLSQSRPDSLDFESLKSSFHSQISSYAWHSKCKYLLLGPMMQHINIDNEIDNLMADLSRCITTNYLAPSSSNIYKQILSHLSSRTDGLKCWNDHCCFLLVNALISSKSLESKNAAQYWLPLTLQHLPLSLNSMLSGIETMEGNAQIETMEGNAQIVQSHLTSASPGGEIPHSSIIFAKLSILHAAKMTGLFYAYPLRELKFALDDSSNDLRLAAFNLICLSPNTTDCPSEDDRDLMKTYLVHQMSVDDPAFRKQLEKCLRTICVRCRDHGLSKLRLKQKNKTVCADGDINELYISICIDVVNSIWKSCLQNLSPSSNFQRLHSSLTWMKIILNVFVAKPHQSIRKGIIPPDVSLFLSLANKRGSCAFFSESSTFSLFSCIFSGIDVISEMAAEMMQFYFPWPLNFKHPFVLQISTNLKNKDNPITSNRKTVLASFNNDFDLDIWLMEESLRLCNNFRAIESYGGVVLGGLLFARSIIEQKTKFNFNRSSNYQISVVRDPLMTACSALAAGIQFLEQLFDIVEKDFEYVKSDIVNKVSDLPLHGMLSLFTLCLKKLPLAERDDAEDLKHLKIMGSKIISFIHNLVSLLLDIFGGRLLSDETAPSFEQMSRAVMDLIVRSNQLITNGTAEQQCCKSGPSGDGDDDDVHSETIAKLHRVVTTWCWLTIKECGLLLGELMKHSCRNNYETLLHEDVDEIGFVYFKVLTRCRHRGAIESCTLGFLDFCQSLLRSADKSLHDIPSKLVDKVFEQLNALSEASTTRRSAGLPCIIQSVLISEAKVGQSILLRGVVERLLEVASSEHVKQSFQQQQDHPQVHAMNILKVLVHESNLSDAMSQFLEAIILLTLEGFVSDNWMIRNASLQLFGSLVPRMIGEKTTADETLGTTNASKFFMRFPKFSQSVVSIFNNETERMKNTMEFFIDSTKQFPSSSSSDVPSLSSSLPSSSSAHDVLVPILSLLVRLSPGYQSYDSLTCIQKNVCYLVQNLCHSPLLVVRQLSAKVLPVFIGRDDFYSFLIFLVTSLPVDQNTNRLSTNHIHGLLLQFNELSSAALECLSVPDLESIKHNLESRSWLLSCSCPLIRVVYLKAFSTWLPASEVLFEHVSDEAMIGLSGRNFEAGSVLYQQSLISIKLSSLNDSTKLTEFIVFCLNLKTPEALQTTLHWILNHRKKILNIEVGLISDVMWKLLENDYRIKTSPNKTEAQNEKLSWSSLCSVLDVLCFLNQMCFSQSEEFVDSKWTILIEYCKVPVLLRYVIISDELMELSECEKKAGDEMIAERGRSSDEAIAMSTSSFTPSRFALKLLSQLLSNVLTANMMAPKQILRKCLLWSGMISRCSKCMRNVDLRKMSVEVFRDVTPKFLKYLTGCVAIDEHGVFIVIIRLLEAGLNYLTDEESDVRMLAAETICLVRRKELINNFMNSSVHHEIAIRTWLHMIAEVAGNCPGVLQFLFNLLDESSTILALKNYFKNTRSKVDEVFQAEDGNPFYEAHQVHNQIVYCFLQNSLNIDCTEFLEKKAASLAENIEELINIFQVFGKSNSLELISNKKLAICISSVHCRSILLRKFAESCSTSSEKIIKPLVERYPILESSAKALIKLCSGNGDFR